MRIVKPDAIGYCSGVRRAIELCEEALKRFDSVVTDGPVVHNDQAMAGLYALGLKLTDAPPRRADAVIIRAHGISPIRRRRLEACGCGIIDATCPNVVRNQNIAAEAFAEGVFLVVAGDAGHDEVKGIVGHAQDAAAVISDCRDAEAAAMPAAAPVLLIAQTTFDTGLFNDMAAILRRRRPECRVKNTICDDTRRRQDETETLCRSVDALIVVGGGKSANTARLANIGRKYLDKVFLIETAAEIDRDALAGVRTVGVAAGASTPDATVGEVMDALAGM